MMDAERNRRPAATSDKPPPAADDEPPLYLTQLPACVPNGWVVVHNHVQPSRRLGDRGFRAWLDRPDNRRLERCPCGWAPMLPSYYRISSPDESEPPPEAA